MSNNKEADGGANIKKKNEQSPIGNNVIGTLKAHNEPPLPPSLRICGGGARKGKDWIKFFFKALYTQNHSHSCFFLKISFSYFLFFP